MSKGLGLCVVLLALYSMPAWAQQQPSGVVMGPDGTITTFDNGSGFSVGPQGTTSWDQSGGYQFGPGGTATWSGPVEVAPEPEGQPEILLPAPEGGE